MKMPAHANVMLSRQEGFSLVEVMVALTVFAIGMLSLAAMQVAAINGNAAARKMTEAGMIAQDGMERAMQEPYTTTLARWNSGNPTRCFNRSGTGEHTPYYTPGQDLWCANTEYLLDILSLPAGNVTTADALMIEVTGFWDEGSGRGRTVPLTSVKSQNVESSYVP